MANKEQLKMLKSGDIEAWNRWCENSHGIFLDLSHADLIGSDLSGADLAGANLTNAFLTGTNLTGTNLRGANLTDANLSDANLSGANLMDANLSDADLTKANLRYADLTYTNLTEADLSGAKLKSADLTGANLMDVSFLGANITNAKIWQVKKLTQDQINSAVFDPETRPILPEGFTLPKPPKTRGAGHEGADLRYAKQTLPEIKSVAIDEANEDIATPEEDIGTEKFAEKYPDVVFGSVITSD